MGYKGETGDKKDKRLIKAASGNRIEKKGQVWGNVLSSS